MKGELVFIIWGQKGDPDFLRLGPQMGKFSLKECALLCVGQREQWLSYGDSGSVGPGVGRHFFTMSLDKGRL